MTRTVGRLLFELALAADPHDPDLEVLIEQHLAKRPGVDRGSALTGRATLDARATAAAQQRSVFCGEHPDECSCGGVGHGDEVRYGPGVGGITSRRGSP
jgi:hypothetical protein